MIGTSRSQCSTCGTPSSRCSTQQRSTTCRAWPRSCMRSCARPRSPMSPCGSTLQHATSAGRRTCAEHPQWNTTTTGLQPPPPLRHRNHQSRQGRAHARAPPMHDQCLKISTLDLWDTVEPVLYAAEKYNMPGLASIVRALLRTHSPTSPCSSTLQHATSAGRRTHARRPPTRSQSTSDLKNRPALFELHHERRKQFRQRIAESPFLTDVQLTDVTRCSHCHDSIPYVEWCELRNVVFALLPLSTCSRHHTSSTHSIWIKVSHYDQCWSAVLHRDRALAGRRRYPMHRRGIILKPPCRRDTAHIPGDLRGCSLWSDAEGWTCALRSRDVCK